MSLQGQFSLSLSFSPNPTDLSSLSSISTTVSFQSASSRRHVHPLYGHLWTVSLGYYVHLRVSDYSLHSFSLTDLKYPIQSSSVYSPSSSDRAASRAAEVNDLSLPRWNISLFQEPFAIDGERRGEWRGESRAERRGGRREGPMVSHSDPLFSSTFFSYRQDSMWSPTYLERQERIRRAELGLLDESSHSLQ